MKPAIRIIIYTNCVRYLDCLLFIPAEMLSSCINGDGNPVENHDTGECASCGAARRKEERRASQVKVVKPIRKVSSERSKENQVYARLRKEYLEAYPCCEVPECHRKASEIHHQKGRAGDLLTNTDYFMAVCHDHHHMITVDSAWAIKMGYSILRSV